MRKLTTTKAKSLIRYNRWKRVNVRRPRRLRVQDSDND